MGMDIRFPIGLMFSVVGVLLTVFGAFSRREIYRVSLGINMNLAWGLVLLAFGVVMLLFVHVGKRVNACAKRKQPVKRRGAENERNRRPGFDDAGCLPDRALPPSLRNPAGSVSCARPSQSHWYRHAGTGQPGECDSASR